jgi:acetylornithine deacetylase/succinyl-diaminopimelate desuccinylase-like protein
MGPAAAHLYSCVHTTFSPNTLASQTKTNVIPDTVTIDVDVRTLPGEGPTRSPSHLREALGDLADHVEVEPLMNDRASISPTDTPLWDSPAAGSRSPLPGGEPAPLAHRRASPTPACTATSVPSPTGPVC